MVSLWVFLLDPSVSQPGSVWRESMEANLVAPVTILAASYSSVILTSVTIIKQVFLRKLFCYESLVDIEVSKH